MVKTKKAQTHVEVILSFIIFLGFIFVVLYFMNPIITPQPSYTSLTAVQNIILANFSFDYQTFSLILNQPVSGCFLIKDGLPIQNGFIVVDSSNTILPSKQVSGDVYIDVTYADSSIDKRYYTFLVSNKFYNAPMIDVGCSEITSDKYSLGILSYQNAIFEDDLKNFTNEYVLDYNGLRKNLGINDEFNFIVYDLSRNVLYNESLSVNSPVMGNILSRDIPLTMINSTGGKNQIIFNLRVW